MTIYLSVFLCLFVSMIMQVHVLLVGNSRKKKQVGSWLQLTYLLILFAPSGA